MRRLVLLFVFIGAVLSLSVPLAAQQDNDPETPTTFLNVIDTEPQTGAELGLEMPVTFYFDRALDCDTAQGAFEVLPASDGTLTCEEMTLTWTPDQPYPLATTHTFTLDDSLRGANGEALAEPFTLTLNTIGTLVVTNTLPAKGSPEVQVDQRLTVIFNRPIVPLTLLSEMENQPDPLTIIPAIEGTGEWLNSSVYVFTPATNWTGGVTYTVGVDPALTSLDGATMQTPYSFSFTTLMPAVIEATPTVTETGFGLNVPIQFRFNQPIDRASFEENFMLSIDGVADVPVTGTFEWTDDSTGVKYTHSENLAMSTPYMFGFPADSVFESTGQSALPAFERSFVTVGMPAIITTEPADGETRDAYGNFQIYFATRMNPETLNDKITIEPEPRGEIDYFYADWNLRLGVSFAAEPSTQYTVSIAPGMEDVYGNTIDEPFTFTFFTGRLSPFLELVVPSGYLGFYDADRQPTEMFLTHRNVSQVNLSLYRIPMDTFLNTLNTSSYYEGFNTLAANANELLKAWTIPNVAPENTLRYERLNLSDFSAVSGQSAPAVTVCEGAPATRTKVGDVATVITAPDPLRARSTPVTGEIIELLYRGYQFEIVGGPVCANGFYWWEVSLREGERGWVAEGAPNEYFFEVTIAAQQTAFTLPEEFANAASLPAGIYMLRASAPEYTDYDDGVINKVMVVGTANLTLKSAIDSATVWATDIRSGQPLANVPLTLYAMGPASTPLNATTNAEGIAQFTFNRRDNLYEPMTVVLDDGENFGIGWSEMSDGIEPWWFSLQYNYYPQRYSFYIYTERPVYRPGQPVYFRGILREKDDITYTVPELDSVSVIISNDEGEEVYQKDVALTEFGTFADTFMLDADAGVGFYNIQVELPTEPPYNRESGSTAFNVAEYRVPEFEVNVSSDATEYVDGDTIRYEVDTRYFFGGSVVNADVNYTVYATGLYFDYTGRGNYSFEDIDYERGFEFFYGDVIASGTGTTDADGKLVIEIPADLNQPYSQSFELEATVMDSSGFSVSGRQSVNVRASEVNVGVAPTSYVGNVGAESTLDIITVDRDSAPMPNISVSVEVFERRWSSVQRLDQNTGRVTYDSEYEDIPVAEGTVTTDAEGRATFGFTPPNGGVYRAIVKTADSQGREARASTSQWVSSSEPIAWRIENNNRIELIADRKSYEVGDTAEILIQSPFTGTAEALITVERGDVMRTERVSIASNAYVHPIEITEDMAPNAYVSVFIVKGVDEQNPVAQFRMGMINLNVDRSRKVLNIALEADREFAGPGDTINYTVTTTNYTGAPVRAEVGVSLTDLAVLSLAQEYNAPILDAFYSLVGIGVRTASVLTINTDLLTQYTLDVIKGGGGGGGGGGMGVYFLREEFVDTPYWNANLVTDENGQATFSVTLPDNLTTWRLDARGITNSDDGDTLVGHETLDIVSTRPVLVRPAVPRFFVVGDEVRLGAVVNNNTNEALSVVVNMDATGVLQRSAEDAQTVEIAANSSARVWWDVTINDVEAVELIFYANANDGEYTDAARPRDAVDGMIPVYKYEAPETVGTSGVLNAAGTRVENVVIPRRLNVTQGELSINVQSSLAGAIFDTLEVLERDACECLTLTAYKLMANAEAKRLLAETGSEDATLIAQFDAAVNLALQRIAANQRVNGGWSWYPEGDVDIYTTAQVVLALLTARDAGYAVDSDIMLRGVIYLSARIENEYPAGFNTFVAYLLARAGKPNTALISNLFDDRATLGVHSKALLMMAMPEGDPRITVLRDDLFAEVILSANGAHWESEGGYMNWSSDIRTTTLVIKALLEVEPQNELLPNAVRWLMIARRGDAWHTSEENAWVISTLTDWMIATGELNANYEYTVSVNDDTVVDDTFTPQTVDEGSFTALSVDALKTDAPNVIELERGAGDGAMYYTAYLRAYLSVPTIQPVDRGLIVSRVYTRPGSTEPITEARVGELVQVRLTVIVPNESYYVVVEDPLPAGVEGIDPTLQTSAQTETDPTMERQDDPLSFGWGWYFFSSIQFEDERVVLSSQYLNAGTYEFIYSIRPSIEGVYNVIPPTASQYYLPEVFGRGAGSTFTVLPAQDTQE